MVFLRLTVKIFPRDQAQSSAPSFLRSLIGDRDRDDSNRSSVDSSNGKPVSFLIVLEDPEEVTLGGLAGLIQEKWRKLRPNTEPLDIKKLLDDDHESDDLDADMTVSQVFVDNGKARVDGHDQRATVRVIQKPAPYAPVRYPSVTQDWDAAAQTFEEKMKMKKEEAKMSVHKFPTIAEESQGYDSFSSSVNGRAPADTASTEDRRHDQPVLSVEKEIPVSPPSWGQKPLVHEEDSQARQESTVASTPQHKRMASQELGDSPTPTHPRSVRSQGSGSKQGSAPRQGSVPRAGSTQRSITRMSEAKSPPSGQPKQGDGSESPLGTRSRSQSARATDFIETQAQEDDDDESGESGESEEETEEETEDDEEGETESETDDSEDGEQNRDGDGDVTMKEDNAVTKKNDQPSTDALSVEANKSTTAPTDTTHVDFPETRLRKRKMSQEDLVPNKEPRLNAAGTPSSSKADKSDRQTGNETVAPSSNPSALRKRERAPSFSDSGRRPSIERASEAPKSGLGLGITRSPPGKKPVMLDISQDSTKSGDPVPSQDTIAATPIFPSSAPTARRSSLQQNSTPSKVSTPAMNRVKGGLQSVLRKDSPADRPSERRSVSFAEGEEILTGPGSAPPKSTPRTNPKESTPKSTPRSGGKPVDPKSVVFPKGYSQEKIEQMMKEAEEKLEKEKQEKEAKEELQKKIKTLEGKNEEPEYLSKLRALSTTWDQLTKISKGGRSRPQLRTKFENLQKEVATYEAEKAGGNTNGETKSNTKGNANGETNKKSSTPSQPHKKATATPASAKTSAKKTGSTDSTSKQPVAPKEKTSEKKTPVTNGHTEPAEKIDATQAIEPNTSQLQSSQPQQPQQQAKPTESATTGSAKTPHAETPTPAVKTRASAKPDPKPAATANGKLPNSSSLSDDASLPSMPTTRSASANQAKDVNGSKPKEGPSPKPTSAQEPVEVSSSSEEESESEESDDDENSDDDEEEDEPAQSKADLLGRARSSAPPQRAQSQTPQSKNTPSQPAASQPQSQPQSQQWARPSPATRPRETLKSLLISQKEQGQEKAQQAKAANAPGARKDVFDPPSDSESEEESESESESESGDDSESGADYGDIQSSGIVGKLRPGARKR